MTAEASVIEKIRKILAKTAEAGCTEDEAETAVALASRLAAQHNIDMASVAASSDDAWGDHEVFEGTQVRLNVNVAAKLTGDFFFVHPFSSYKPNPANGGMLRTVVFFGKKSNVETARFVFSSLVAAIDRLWGDYRAKTRCPLNHRTDFIQGVARGFRAKMNAERAAMTRTGTEEAHRNAIALRSTEIQIQNEFKDHHKDMKFSNQTTRYNGASAACQAGEVAGRNLNINRPLGGSAPKAIEHK